MSQLAYRANLSASTFPFLSENAGRTVIVQGQDNTFVPQIASQADLDKDRGIPQIYYCHNVIPFGQGFQSVGYRELNINQDFEDFIGTAKIRDALNNVALLGYSSTGSIYVKLYEANQWTLLTTLPLTDPVVTVAYVSGITYIYFAGYGCYFYDFTSSTLVPVTLTALDPLQVIGIVGVAGYMIAYSPDTLAWSSTIDPTDFTPSLTTGAGGGSAEGLRGPIVTCSVMSSGFLVWSVENCVAAIYSANSRYPFNFKELVNSGGVTNAAQVSNDNSASNIIAYTSSGLQSISSSQVIPMLPEVTDFISGKKFEDFEESTNQFNMTVLNAPMKKRLSTVADRYLILSYGIEEYTHALVYDLATKRFGKLKFTHVECFEYIAADATLDQPRESIAFLRTNGTIAVVELASSYEPAYGVILLGKFQYVRSRMLQLHQVEVENSYSFKDLEVLDWAALDGKNMTPYPMVQLTTAQQLKVYRGKKIGRNHSIMLKGNFSLVSLQLLFSPTGDR